MNLYIVRNDGIIGKVNHVCACDECKNRGEVEYFIDDLEGNPMEVMTAFEFGQYFITTDIDEARRMASAIMRSKEDHIQWLENQLLNSVE